MAKVGVIKYGTIHQHALCSECVWNGDDFLGVNELKAAAKKHTRDTGHATTVETGDSTEYRKIK